jgi:hypothetical protein
MLDIKQIVLDLFTALLASAIGLIVFRRLNLFYRLLLLQVIIYVVIDSIASAIGLISKNTYNNSWLYNVLIFIETSLLFAAAQAYFKSDTSKKVLLLFFGCFLIVFFADVFYLTDFRNFAYHAAITEGLFITGIYITLLYFQFMKKAHIFLTAPIILASVGMVLYFAGTIPDLCLVTYFQKIDPHLNQELFQNIVVVLGDVRYLFIALAFWGAGRISDSAQIKQILHD